jgi:glycine amidinotransferase
LGSEVHQLEQLDKLGFEIVPVPFRDAYPFGGGLHCATTDVYREGRCEFFSQTSERILGFRSVGGKG